MPADTTVIIVTYNAMKWLDKTLTSLQTSNPEPHIIIVDNSSTDDTVNHIETHYPHVQLIKQKTNTGFGSANNTGLKTALDQGSNYFFLLNQDASVQKETLQKLAIALDNNKSFGIISPMHLNGEGTALDHAFSTYISPPGCTDFVSHNALRNKPELNDLYEAVFINAAAWMISKECLQKVGGFDPIFFLYGEDNDYVNRLHYHQFKIGFIPNAIIFHDRPKPAPMEKQPLNKRINWQLNQQLVIIKNPAVNSILTLIKLVLRNMGQGLKKILKLDLKSFWLQIHVTFKLLLLMPRTLRHKKQHKIPHSPII